MKKAAVILAALVLAVFGVAACGGDDDEEETTAAETTATETKGGGGAAATVDLSAPANGSFAFNPKQANAKSGPIEISFDNLASLTHDVVVEDQAGEELGRTEQISKSVDSFTVDLEPGTYTYYCSVPGHRPGGMEGTLTVK